MIPVAPLGWAILGVSQAVGHVLNWYSHDKDRKQRQDFADLREQESKRAYENVLARDEKQAEHSLEMEDYRSRIRIEEAVLGHEQAKDLAHVSAKIKQALQIETERRGRELANSPFAYSLDEAHERVAEHTQDGAVPALLIAPFRYDYPAKRAPAFTIAVRQAWRMAPWASDMNVLDGLITRPLKWPDVDLQTMRNALHDMPVVVVHGHVQANARLWISLTAWNLGDTTGTHVLDMDFAPLMLPPSDEDNIQRRLNFEDSAAGVVSLVAGAYADWFHILRSARLPQMHTRLPSEFDPVRRALAVNGVALYDACVSRGLVSEARARIAQATVLAEAGLTDEAVETVKAALGERRLQMSELTGLAALLRRLAAGPAGPQLAQQLEEMQRYILLIQLGMREIV